MSQYDIVDLLHSFVNIWSDEASPILVRIAQSWRLVSCLSMVFPSRHQHEPIDWEAMWFFSSFSGGIGAEGCDDPRNSRNFLGFLSFRKLPFLKLTVRTWKFVIPKRKLLTPTIYFQVRTTSFQEGKYWTHLFFFWSYFSLFELRFFLWKTVDICWAFHEISGILVGQFPDLCQNCWFDVVLRLVEFFHVADLDQLTIVPWWAQVYLAPTIRPIF